MQVSSNRGTRIILPPASCIRIDLYLHFFSGIRKTLESLSSMSASCGVLVSHFTGINSGWFLIFPFLDKISAFRKNLATLNEDNIDELVEEYAEIQASLKTRFITRVFIEWLHVRHCIRVPAAEELTCIIKEMEKVSYDCRLTLSELLSRFVEEPPTAHPSTADSSAVDPFMVDPCKLKHLTKDIILRCWTKYASCHRSICLLR